MDVSPEASRLLHDGVFIARLSPDIVQLLRYGSNNQYLDTLASLALQPSNTSAIFSVHHALSVELCSRWLQNLKSELDDVDVLAALARILPAAPFVSSYVKELFHKRREGPLASLSSGHVNATSEILEVPLHHILLALCRLLRFDNDGFAHLVKPVQFQLLLSHPQRSTRYLAIRILCLYLHASDSVLQEMVGKYIGQGAINGRWDDKNIDYRFFSLWEEQRLKNLRMDLEQAYEQHKAAESPSTVNRILTHKDFSPSTVCLAGVLLPSPSPNSLIGSSLVMTHTVKRNMQSLAEAIKSNRPVLLTGTLGSGKTSLVKDAAKQLAFDEKMLVLHLNEQTDAKLLIGMYTIAGAPGSFTWQPGVLTKAVTEGRWVLVEDFDRAPAEIVSMILPLLERNEMLVPHWGETVRAAPGFKIIATIRSEDTENGRALPRRTVIGARYWNKVHLRVPPDEELGEIVVQRFPILHAYLPRVLNLYTQMRDGNTNQKWHHRSSGPLGKVSGPRDLFRWCSRVNNLLQSVGVRSGNEPIPETANDSIFLEAVDCFAGRLPDGADKKQIVAIIAQELQISSERVSFCLDTRKPELTINEKVFRVGRTTLSRKRPGATRGQSRKQQLNPFAATNRVLRHLESVGMSIKMAEPCLLVGETGTGKTTIVQQLAESLNHKLVVVNLSQQSEAGDLLGGFKPVNMRALAIPMRDEFNDLFESTFSSRKNQRYVEHTSKAVSKNRWSRALTLWREATKTVGSTFKSQNDLHNINEEPASKKRKVITPKHQTLRKRWENFAGQLTTFQKHLESGSKGFAFSFVEGNIVKAARNGDWVLLDEINLAAPDTLDSLADLFAHEHDEGPSLLLTETGETERIRAHKDFRIFGAMNPANDIGKRDLPLSLRSRFTELYIDAPDKDVDNLVPVVQAYLGSVSLTDARVFSDIAHLYLDIQGLACENRLVDGADQKPHFSLRTLTRTLVYVLDIAPLYGLRRALFEGFSMSFLTLLNNASSSYVLLLMDEHLLHNQKNSRALLLRAPKPPQDTERFIKFKQYWMLRGSLPITSQPHYIITPFIEKNLLNLVRATSTRRFPVLLQGPTSSGKTSMVEYLANISGNKFVRINNHEHTDLQEYLGTYVSGPDGQLQYQEGILVQALREGFWIVLDELNLAPTDVLEALNRLLDDNRELFIPETQQIVKPHENFMLFATQNPPGMYGGRKVLSRAFKNRFLELHFDDIPEDELEVILRERSQIAPSFCAKIVAVYKKLSLHRQHSRLFEQKNSFATLRDLFRWAFRDADDREQLALNGYYLLAERVRDDEERQVVKRTIEDVMKTKIDDDALYAMDKLGSHIGPPATAYGVVLTKSMRRLYVLVTEALKNHEPVLLVGETGSGKTTVCQVVAAVMQNELHIVNAHQNMETGDLIGSQRPIRTRHSIEAQLHELLEGILLDRLDPTQLGDNSLQTLVQLYQDLPKQLLESLPPQKRQMLDGCLSQFNALFKWADGSLVHAMKAGHHFLLDEISLADDSVLERLNSVLEPSRYLFLAEKGVNDAHVTAAEGFQFLATMNPGGDYGKKELSPALRNRFTEVWVPHASDREEMEEILRQKLGKSHTHYAKPMVTFAHWYGGRFTNTAPQITIRDLLAWVAFFNTRCILDDKLLLLHGAALVYVDTLGANPAAKLQTLGSAVEEQRQDCLNKLSELFGINMASINWKAIGLDLEADRLVIGPYKLRKNPVTSSDPRYSLQAPSTARNAMKIARALQLPRPILLEGSPGVGKTTLVAALAQACGMPLTRINLSDQTDLVDLFGSDVPVEGGIAGQFQWREAPFLGAMQKGEWVLLDEMNLASQSVLEGLNACFDHRGQVYVPELDQTFTRHPNFVVFAAQNPHHQGSGRKGLPTSFVNRFTVVYTDTFKANDLLMICSEKFPNMSIEHITTLTECVVETDLALQQDRRLIMRGGPWEINLRDTMRWLDLLSSATGLLPVAKAEDHVAMLFSQRFRSPEDADAMLSMIERHLPQVRERHDQLIGLHADHAQVGLGLLSRRVASSCSTNQYHSLPYSHLPLIESVMLCIQKSWPVLLVGPPGSGKTALIRHIAGCVGADLVELSIHADMDTTDLVGGYEQLDSQRESAAFIHRLTDFTKNARLQRLRSCLDAFKPLAELENILAAGFVEMSKIVKALRRIVEEYSDIGFDTYLLEGMVIVEKSLHDNRARFEWVDGILVKSIVEGKWLILDNANLCSPSVLDRLNSLLEPNGVLIINERRSLDGSARVIKPHPDFRLFLTMDPQHGELSRAMRNRNIELFVPMPEAFQPYNGINLTLDSFMVRFEQFQRIFSSSIQDSDFHELVWICLDHLTFSDHDLIKSWREQVSAGLADISSECQRTFSSIIQLFDKVLQSGGSMMEGIQDAHRRALHHLDVPPGFEATQTMQPLNNAMIVVHDLEVNQCNDLLRFSAIMDLLIDVIRFEDQLAPILDHTGEQTPSQLTRLQRSVASTRSRRFNEDSTEPLAPFLAGSIKTLLLALKRMDSPQSLRPQDGPVQSVEKVDILALRAYFFFLTDIFGITHSHDFDEAVFLLYLEIGKNVIAGLRSLPTMTELTEGLETGLNRFKAVWQLHSGQSIDLIWSHLKPPTPTTFEQLYLNMEVEQLADRFDGLLWKSNVTLPRLTELRQSIARIGQVMDSNTYGPGRDLEKISEALKNLEAEQDVLLDTTLPYFQPEFEALRQYRAASAEVNAAGSELAIGLVAGEPTKELWRQGSNVAKSTGISNKETALAGIRRSFPLSVLKKLEYSMEVPLRSLNLLSEEVALMARNTAKLTSTISSDHHSMLLHVLKNLHHQIYIAHRDYLQPYDHWEVNSSKTPWQLREQLASSHYLRNIVGRFLQPSWALVAGNGGEHTLKDTAFAWILFFVGCLRLYVPDHPYDPALKPMVARNRHRKRIKALHKKLLALQQFERLTTGQNTNLRCRLVEQELEALGEEPATETILRPKISELTQLQGEFTNVLRSIVYRSPDQNTLDHLSTNDQAAICGIELLQSNIAQAIKRLGQNYRTYDDITEPLVAMLQGLDAGLAIAQIATAPGSCQAKAIEYICRSTPFFGMRPSLKEMEFYESDKPVDALHDQRLKFIESFAVINGMTKSANAIAPWMVFKAFQSIYKDWKQRLSEDQRKNLAKSSMYRYRGTEADLDAADDQDFHELFPDFQVADDEAPKKSKAQCSPQEIAQRLAQYQRRLFDSELRPVDHIRDLMRSSCTDIARVWESDSTVSTSPLPTQDMLCGLILKLDENLDRLGQVAQRPSLYNFYNDANLPEAQKLVSIVRRLRARFLELKQAWPEHSTLDDVLRTASDLLTLRHIEPVAKLITKVEQLHEYVHQWQMVASREYTAAALYDDLTSLIVDWRRLELATWSRLFDMEDKKYEEEVDAWWFVAYEAIVAAPLSILESGGELTDHAQELFKTLQEFIVNSSVGQFPLRVRMVQTFREYVALIQQSAPAFGIVHSALSNFLAFFSRYTIQVKQVLHTGRLVLEKEMKDVLLLASWKDTNVNALRDSAKRSHHKLFKVVRKYRDLLAQPAQSQVEQGFPELASVPQVSSVQGGRGLHYPDTRALQICQDSVGWSERPARFRTISITVSNMASMSQLRTSTMEIPAYLDHLTKSLSEDVKSLRKETPATTTDDNVDLLKHLTVRKRKLFSDVLKSVRHMGFRSNLSADVLSQQASLAVILTRIPPSEAAETSHQVRASEHHLHHFLKLMTTVREAARWHSEDLNGSEVARSIGYFESMLSAALKQRIFSGEFVTGLTSLDRTIEKMQSIWKPESNSITLQDQGSDEVDNVKRVVTCLPHIIETACLIIEKHGKLGRLDHRDILTSLREWSKHFTAAAVAFEQEQPLPEKLTFYQYQSNFARAQSLLKTFKSDLTSKIKEYPGLAFVLLQIELWTDTSSGLRNGHTRHGAFVKLKDFNQDLLKICDSILVATQNYGKEITEEFSSEDRNWLVNSEKQLANSVRALHLGKIFTSTDELLSKMCRLSQEDLTKAAALTAVALPIVSQYRDICHNVLNHITNKSLAMNKLAATLAQSFSQIASQGFCNPSKSGAAEAGKNEKLEEGTGLGEGEGAEDISKDIQDDEDLTELAQAGQKSKERDEIEDQEDAVSMDQEDAVSMDQESLEGEMGDAEEKGEDGGKASEGGSEDNEIDEETGDVDDLDPNAVDEKLWDDDSKEAKKEKEGAKAKGQSKKDDTAQADGDKEGADADEEKDLNETGAEEGEEVVQQEAEMMDPRAQQEENLDLPDEMDFDGLDKASVGSDIEDSDIDALSDAGTEDDKKTDRAGSDTETDEEAGPTQDQVTENQQTGTENEEPEGEEVHEAGSPIDTEPENEDQPNEGLLQNQTDDAVVDRDNIVPSDVQGFNGQDVDNEVDIQMQENKASGGTGHANEQAQAEQQPQAAAKEGELGNLQDKSQASESRDPTFEDFTSQAFKKLGDALETWHRQQREIQNARSSPAPEQDTSDVDMTNTEFQHLENENDKADTQALGAATENQANALDRRAFDSELQDQPHNFLPNEAEQNQDEDTTMEESNPQQILSDNHQEQPKLSTFIGPNARQNPSHNLQSTPIHNESDLKDLDTNLSLTHLAPPFPSPSLSRSLDSARSLWTHYASTTHSLSLTLTSQLRLILTPTLATKMRGDFRTGKRLNIKRIIPYIASDYKRDKIWMRRSIPSKRNYQIMLAVDDSRSMSEGESNNGGAEGLAFETLALVAKSLSMLEVGEICILGFGEDVKVAHPFDRPFTDEAGVEVFRQFGFRQQRTDILRLVSESINLFRQARQSSHGANAGEIWQLELIISDGVCEDHERIRRLVRQATEERIMIVFIIIDSMNANSNASVGGKGTSIVDMQTAVFESASGVEGEEGEKKLKIKRYLDGFPFGYYVVVGDVRELPGVLSQALRGWFGEVVEKG
ncbi:MAG: hypothetical protein Q9166_005779 [cf. Caloplaca sp. 2 TL-2023]